jgi:uncharacterized protein YijF (DUF1287 family)
MPVVRHPALDDRDLTPFERAVVRDLSRQERAQIWYHDAYYQGGDPPPDVGVCTDVVVRAYRAGGVDLHALVAADVRNYPHAYGIARPDPNIDYRRCRNLVVYFRRHAAEIASAQDWRPGDVVFWSTHRDGRIDHVGVVSNDLDQEGAPAVFDHWPGDYVAEKGCLFAWPIVRHFRMTTAPG